MPSWVLAIDFGTSYTVAAVKVDDRPPEVIEVGGERRIPSVVLVDGDNDILVGRPADDLAVTHPGNALRAIKNRLGDPTPVILGGRPYQVVNLVAALLRDAYTQVLQQMGEPPAQVRLTHPATWSQPRLNRLLEAAAKAGLPRPVLVPEPVAAALSFAAEVGVDEGQHIVVYDLGGGTFDTAVVARVDGELTIVGRPIGDQNIGGELFDELLVNHIGEQLDPEVWDSILIGDDMLWQQVGVALRNEARKAKEALSSHPYVNVIVPLPTAGLWQTRLTRDTFDELVRPFVAETITLLRRCVDEAGVEATELAGISLVGGSSRSPIVEQMVKEAYPEVPVSRRGDPKAAVAAGATRATGSVVMDAPARAEAITHDAAAGTAVQAVRLATPSGDPSVAAPPADAVSTPAGPTSLPPPPPQSWPPAAASAAAVPVATTSAESAATSPAEPAQQPTAPAPAQPAAPPTVTAADATPGAPPPAPGEVIVTPAKPRRRRRTALIGAGVVVVAALVAGSVLLATRDSDNSDSDDDGDDTATEATATAFATLPHDATVWSAEYSPSGEMIVTASADGTAKLWDTASGSELYTLAAHDGEVVDAQFSPDGAWVVTASDDDTAKIWDAQTGEEKMTLWGHEEAVVSAQFSPDGSKVVTASADHTAKLWDPVTGQKLYNFEGHGDRVVSAVFSADGARVLTASWDGTAKEWSVETGEEVGAYVGHGSTVNTAQFNPDGTRVVTASDDGTARLWDATNGEELYSFEFDDAVRWAAFSPDGTLIVTAGADGVAHIWDAFRYDELATLEGHTDAIVDAAFTPNSHLLATASIDGTARVWDTGTGEELVVLDEHDSEVVHVGFSPDGSDLVTASVDATAKMWTS